MTTPLPPAFEDALTDAAAAWTLRFGLGSQLALFQAASTALSQLTAPGSESDTASSAATACEQLEQRHVQQHGTRALADERADDDARTAALASDAALVTYQRDWELRFARQARRRALRLRVPGLSPEELCDALTLRLVEVLRSGNEDPCAYCRPGKAWGWVVAEHHLKELRKRFRLGAAPTDFAAVSVAERRLTQEESWLELEENTCRSLAVSQAQALLNSSQRRWFAALRLAAQCGEFFERSDRLNLSAASRLLGKDRSSALRAYRELQTQFQAELSRVL